MTFASPVALVALLVIPLIVVVHLWSRRRRTRYALRYTNLHVLASIETRSPLRRRYLPPALFLTGLAALLIGAARPHAEVVLPREEATVVLALDVSASMRASDIPPTRLDAAKEAAARFLDQVPPRFQLGVVTFSDRAQVLTQPTTDRVVVREAIASLEADGATAIGDAIAEALRLDPEEGTRLRASREPIEVSDAVRPLTAILLLSDGSNTAGKLDPLEAAERARDMRLPVYTIALGPDEETVEVPYSLSNAAPPDYATLREIARTTGGKYFGAPTVQDLRSIYNSLASRLGLVKEHQEVSFAFAGAGLLLAAAATVLAARWTWRAS